VNASLASAEFSTGEVSRIARVTLRQLQWWDETGVLAVGRKGRRRVWRAPEVLEVLLAAELRQKGLSLRVVSRLLRAVGRSLEELAEPLLQQRCGLYLLTDGRTAHLERDESAVIERLKRARRPMLLVSIADHAARLRHFAAEQPARASQLRRRAASNQLPLFG
jgi:DNA-binding transcriptional MerR regulator